MPIHTMGNREMAEARGRSHRLTVTVVVLAAVCVVRGVAEDVSVVSPVSGRTVRAAAGRVLVRFRDGTDAAAALKGSDRVASADLLAGGRLAVVRLALGADVEGAVRALKAHPNVLAAEPDYVVRVSITPNDTLWDRQCGLRRLRCPDAWDVERGRPDVTVAILDTGVTYDHPDLAAHQPR
jgi:subtilisin family serine protease